MHEAELLALLGAGTRLLRVPVDPAWEAAILVHLRVVFGMVDQITAFPGLDEIEAAPVFVP